MPVLKPVFGIFAVLGWVFLIGLHIVWHYTFGWLFTTLADLLDSVEINAKFIHVRPFGTPAAWLRSLDRNVDASLVKAANKLEHVAVWLFSRVAHFLGSVADEIAGLAVAVEHKFLRILRVTIPRLVRNLLKFVWRELRALGRYARKMIPKLARQLLRFTRWAVHEIAKGARHLGFLWKWAKAVLRLHWRVIKGALKRLLALERALTPKGFRRLLIAALGPLGLLWLFGDSVRRFGAGVLGWSYHLVTAFVRYFKKLNEPFVLKEFIAVERELTHLVLHELDFIVSEFKPQRLEPPGPPFGPPA